MTVAELMAKLRDVPPGADIRVSIDGPPDVLATAAILTSYWIAPKDGGTQSSFVIQAVIKK